MIGISRSTLSAWKAKHESIRNALNIGKEYADRLVEHRLYEMAKGIRITVKKPIKIRKVIYDNGKRVEETEEVVMTDEEIYIPPNFAAISFWLRNRKPDTWRDKIVEQQGGGDGGPNLVILTPRQADALKKEVTEQDAKESEKAAE